MKIIIIKFKKRKGKYGNKETKTFRFKASILKLQKIRWTDLVFPFASPRPSEVLAGCTILRSGSTCRAEKAKMIGKGRKEDSSFARFVNKVVSQEI